MIGRSQGDETSVWAYTYRRSNKQEVALATYLRGSFAEKGLAERSLRELRIEAACCVETYLPGKIAL